MPHSLRVHSGAASLFAVRQAFDFYPICVILGNSFDRLDRGIISRHHPVIAVISSAGPVARRTHGLGFVAEDR